MARKNRRVYLLAAIGAIAAVIGVGALSLGRPQPYPFLTGAKVLKDEEWIAKPSIIIGRGTKPLVTPNPSLATNAVYRHDRSAADLATEVRRTLGKQGWTEVRVHGDFVFNNGHSHVTIQPRPDGATIYIQTYRRPNVIDHARLWWKKTID